MLLSAVSVGISILLFLGLIGSVTGSIRSDAAVAGRQADGRPRILRVPARPDRDQLFTGGQWGLAPGLVIALFPAAAVGSPLRTGAACALTVLGVLARAVSDGMSRAELEDLGTELDSGGAALVVVTTARGARELRPLIEEYGRAVSALAEIDVETLESDLQQAEQEWRASAETQPLTIGLLDRWWSAGAGPATGPAWSGTMPAAMRRSRSGRAESEQSVMIEQETIGDGGYPSG